MMSIHHSFDSKKMKTNHISHLMAIKACTVSGDVERGKEIHSVLEKELIQNIQIETALIDFYGECGDIENALSVLYRIGDRRRNIIAINALMAAFNDNERYAEALALYDDDKNKWFRKGMIEKDDTTKMLAIKSCTNLGEFDRGIAIHHELRSKYSLNSDHGLSVVMKTTLIALYGHSGDLETAQRLFDSIEDGDKDIFCIDTMMEALCNNGQNAECIELFDKMGEIRNGIEPDVVSYVTALKACTNGTMLNIGTRIHEELISNVKEEIWRHKNIQIHLINMYGKCAMLTECERLFDDIKQRDDELYRSEIGIINAMLFAYGRNGDMESVRRVYSMIRGHGGDSELRVVADRKTYILMITACSHHGEVDEGLRIWNEDIKDEEMKRDEYVMSALLDGMSRRGMLEDVMELILQHHADCKVMWMSLLSGCRQHSDSNMAHRVFAKIQSRFSDDQSLLTSASILLANISAVDSLP